MAIKGQEVDFLNENLHSGHGEYLAVNALVKLNHDLKLLRESIRKKKAEREQARKEGKKVAIDLDPEIRRLVQLLSEIDNLSKKLKSFELTATGKNAEQANSPSNTLGQLKAQLEGERNKLEAEREFDNQQQATIQQEPEALKELPIKPTENAAVALPPPERIEQAEEKRRVSDEDERALQTRMADQLQAMKSELLDLKARLSGEQQALGERRREIDEEKRRIEEQKKALES